MSTPSIVLICPPIVKPSEPPAGIARLAGALRSRGADCTVIDANIEGIHHLLDTVDPPDDTWSQRAFHHMPVHLAALRSEETYRQPDRYRRAVADFNRLLSVSGRAFHTRLGLADFKDEHLSPLRSDDLLEAADTPERNPFCEYYQGKLLNRIFESHPDVVGISINFLSQALCAFALIGLLKRAAKQIKVLVGGGLMTSWMQWPERIGRFSPLVDRVVAGPGESALFEEMGMSATGKGWMPDYSDLIDMPYFSPGFVLPFSASDGCWWRRCAFCPERAERRPFRPLAHTVAAEQLRQLTALNRPVLIHLLDNAISPALLKRLVESPPGAPWYGFVRIAPPLDDLEFCRQLAASGCTMLKLGLESGSQRVLDRLEKGVRLDMASKVLRNLHRAGIATYVYLLFGTPAEDQVAAGKTLSFVADHHETISFLNLAVFNLPIGSPDAEGLVPRDFYEGDLVLYRDFEHPAGWGRAAVRQFLEKQFKKHPNIQEIVRRDPPAFTSNHAAFFKTVFQYNR